MGTSSLLIRGTRILIPAAKFGLKTWDRCTLIPSADCLPVNLIGRQEFSEEDGPRLSRVYAQREIENDCLFTRDQGNLPNHGRGRS
jgi:hypothetical protein